jgi:hypothetical protein
MTMDTLLSRNTTVITGTITVTTNVINKINETKKSAASSWISDYSKATIVERSNITFGSDHVVLVAAAV